jgi:hypothetical protein
MHEKHFFFVFLVRKINLKVLKFFLDKFQRKPGILIQDLYLTV